MASSQLCVIKVSSELPVTPTPLTSGVNVIKPFMAVSSDKDYTWTVSYRSSPLDIDIDYVSIN